MARPAFDCLTCDKFHPHKEDDLKKGGTCRALPPQPFIMVVGAQITRNPLTQQQIQEPLIQQGAHYPAVAKGDYCFQHPAARAFQLPLLRPAFGSGAQGPMPPSAGGKPPGPGEIGHELTGEEAAGEAATAALNNPKGRG